MNEEDTRSCSVPDTDMGMNTNMVTDMDTDTVEGSILASRRSWETRATWVIARCMVLRRMTRTMGVLRLCVCWLLVHRRWGCVSTFCIWLFLHFFRHAMRDSRKVLTAGDAAKACGSQLELGDHI